MSLVIGMTGARDGMTEAQKERFASGLNYLQATELHHGDCVGADADAHDLAKLEGLRIIVHPPADPTLRAYKEGDVVLKTKGYLDRNRDIVDDSQITFGFPRGMSETGGGTWYTINYAKKRGVPLYIIYPDGTLAKFNMKRGKIV